MQSALLRGSGNLTEDEMAHFDKGNDKVVGVYLYNGKEYPLLQYKDPSYRPERRVTTGTKGGRHRCIYVWEWAKDSRFIRVPESDFAGVDDQFMGGSREGGGKPA